MDVVPLGPGFAAEWRGVMLADVACDDAACSSARTMGDRAAPVESGSGAPAPASQQALISSPRSGFRWRSSPQ